MIRTPVALFSETLADLYRAAIEAAHGRRCVRLALAGESVLRWSAVAIGKAAEAMMAGACDALGDSLERGLVVRKAGLRDDQSPLHGAIEVLDAAHPVPDLSSLAAGGRLVRFVEAAPVEGRFLFLISGGASSLVELLPAGVTLAQWQRLNRWLLGSGLDIAQINTIRRRVSLLKGGGLLRYLGGREAHSLLISDVPDDDPATIGSGLLTPSPAVPLPPVPEWVRQIVRDDGSAARGESGNTVPDQRVVATNACAVEGAIARARECGIAARSGAERLSGDAVEQARRLVMAVREGPAGVAVWGGETVVSLPARFGRGGRNLHLALAAAIALDGQGGVSLLAAGTDGDDGSSEYAGAIVDGATVSRGRAAGLDPQACLAEFDSERFLRVASATFATGATGTNVGDIVIAMTD